MAENVLCEFPKQLKVAEMLRLAGLGNVGKTGAEKRGKRKAHIAPSCCWSLIELELQLLWIMDNGDRRSPFL